VNFSKLLRKTISIVIAVAILLSIAAPVLAEVAEQSVDSVKYLALGDGMTEGIGLDEKTEDTYVLKIAKKLGYEDAYEFVADSGWRVEELRYLIDKDYKGDGYTKKISADHNYQNDKEFGWTIGDVKSAEYITISAGVNNFSTYLVEQMMYFVENGGAVKYSYDIGEVLDEYDLGKLSDNNVYDVMENVKNLVKTELQAAAGDTMGDAIELVDFVAEVSVYTLLSYVTSFNALINEIYALNPDVEVYVIGIYNPMAGEIVSVTVGDKTKSVNIGRFFNALVEMANAYTQILAPRVYDYTYVHPGNPELLIDVMGNDKLDITERIPAGLPGKLAAGAEDTAAGMIQDMYAQYGIEKDYDEALDLAFEILNAKDDDERREIIKEEIGDMAADEVLERFKEQLANKEFEDTYGYKITVDEEKVQKLLKDLESAADEEGRKKVAADFVVDLMTLAMVGETFAGIKIDTQEDAYKAIEVLEKNAEATDGDPEALREAAAAMVIAEIGEDNVLGIDEADVVELLELMDIQTTREDREKVVDEWLTEKAVGYITETVQEYVPGYQKADAEGLLAQMEASDTDDDSVIAKNHLLAHFTPVLADAIEEKYTEGGFARQGYGSFTEFANAINTAADEDAVKTLVRDEIRAAAKVAIYDYATTPNPDYFNEILWPACTCPAQNHVSGGACEGVSSNMILEMLVAMDAEADSAAKEAALHQWLVTYMNNGVEPDPNGAFARLFFNPIKEKFLSAYNSYNDAATTAENLCADYHSSVNKASDAFGSYAELKEEAADTIIEKYETSYQGAGETAQKYYKDYVSLRDQAVTKVIDGYDEYQKAINSGMGSVDQLSEKFGKVYELLCDIAEVEVVNLNHVLAVAKKITQNGASYITGMVDDLIQGQEIKDEDRTVAYLALRYYLADSMMIMPSASGHATIANQVIKAINGEDTSSTGGYYANKIIDKAIDVYRCAKAYRDLSSSESGQVGTLINPSLYVALGDNITSGSALSDSSLAYPQLLGDALAMSADDRDGGDRVLNYALNGMRVEELLMLVDENYSGDEYTAERFGTAEIEALREAYKDDIANAELITINAGINNLTTFPIVQTLLAYNGYEPYEMDWGRFIGDSRYEKISDGKEAAMDLVLALVDKAENRVEQLDGYSAYERCERALETASTAVESMLYGFISYIFTLDDAVEQIAELNPDGTIALIGFYNPLEGTYFQVNRTVTVRGKTIDLSQFKVNTDTLGNMMVNLANRFLAHYVGNVAGDGTAADEGSRLLNVKINDTELIINDSTASKDLSTLTTWKEFTLRGKTIPVMVPEYFLQTGRTAGEALHPNEAGHQYITNQILDALDFEIYADVIIEDYTKTYGEKDPDFTHLIDDLSSLWGIEVDDLKITRESGEEVGEYQLFAAYTPEDGHGYTEIDEEIGKLYIEPRAATITVTIENGIITNVAYEKVANKTGVLDGDKERLEAALKVTGTTGAYEVNCDDSYIAKNYALTIKVEEDDEFDYSDAKIEYTQWNMELDGVVYMNVHLDFEGFEPGFDFGENAGLIIWTGEGKPTISSSQFEVDAENCKVVKDAFYSNTYGWGVRTDEVYAANLGDKIYVRAFVQIGENEYIYADNGQAYSPAEFCYNDYLVPAANREERYLNVCAALLAYGAEAQKYFGHDEYLVTDDMSADYNVDLSVYDEVLTFSDAYLDAPIDPDSSVANSLPGTKKYITLDSMELNLVGAIRIIVDYKVDQAAFDWNEDVKTAEVYFWTREAYEAANGQLDYTLDNASYASKLEWSNGDTYIGMSDYILAKDLSDTVYYSCRIELKDGTVYRSGLGRYSPEKFVTEHLTDTTNINNVDELCKAMTVYGEMARICFN